MTCLELKILFLILSGILYTTQNPRFTYKIFVGCQIALSILIAFGDGYLISFHIWLKFKGLSTYQYILKRRQKISNEVIQAAAMPSPSDKGKTLMSFQHKHKSKEESVQRSLVHDLNSSLEQEEEIRVNKSQQIYFNDTEMFVSDN